MGLDISAIVKDLISSSVLRGGKKGSLLRREMNLTSKKKLGHPGRRLRMMSRPWEVIEVISCTKESLNRSVRLPERRALNASAPTPPLPKSDQIWVSSVTAGIAGQAREARLDS
jgi:hypothetical protein